MNPPDSTLTDAGALLVPLAIEAILPPIHESPNPKNVPGGDPRRLRAALEDVLRGTGPFYPGRAEAPRRSFAAARQIESLRSVAGDLKFGPETGRGGEHTIVHEPSEAVAIKLTLPDSYGYGFTIEVADGQLWQRQAVPSEYLARLGLMNVIFGVPSEVIAVVRNPRGNPQIVTRQPWIDGTIPASADLADWLLEQGFLPLAREAQDRGTVTAGSIWYRRADNVLLGDAAPRNFILTGDGIIVPIDVSLTLMPWGLMPAGILVDWPQ